MENLSKSIKDQIIEYLEVSKKLDGALLENVEKQKEMVEMKRSNPLLKFEDVSDKLFEIAQGHQFTSLAVKDLEALMNRLSVLNNLAAIANIDLSDLGEENRYILDNVTLVSRLFFSVEKGELIELQPEVIAKFKETTTEKHLTEENLRLMFNNI